MRGAEGGFERFGGSGFEVSEFIDEGVEEGGNDLVERALTVATETVEVLPVGRRDSGGDFLEALPVLTVRVVWVGEEKGGHREGGLHQNK